MWIRFFSSLPNLGHFWGFFKVPCSSGEQNTYLEKNCKISYLFSNEFYFSKSYHLQIDGRGHVLAAELAAGIHRLKVEEGMSSGGISSSGFPSTPGMNPKFKKKKTIFYIILNEINFFSSSLYQLLHHLLLMLRESVSIYYLTNF